MESSLGWGTHGNLRVNSGNLMLSAFPSSGPSFPFFGCSSKISLPWCTIYSLLHSLLLVLQKKGPWNDFQASIALWRASLPCAQTWVWAPALPSRGSQSGCRAPTPWGKVETSPGVDSLLAAGWRDPLVSFTSSCLNCRATWVVAA